MFFFMFYFKRISLIKLKSFSSNTYKIHTLIYFRINQTMNYLRINFWIIAFLLGFSRISAFLPPIISQKIIITNLESIVTTRALTSSIIENINKEINIEQALLQILPMHFSVNSYIYFSIVLTFLYSQWYLYDESKYNKFEKISKFSKEKRIIKNIIFVLILVFMKDVQSVS